jgi:hypothetical protein
LEYLIVNCGLVEHGADWLPVRRCTHYM